MPSLHPAINQEGKLEKFLPAVRTAALQSLGMAALHIGVDLTCQAESYGDWADSLQPRLSELFQAAQGVWDTYKAELFYAAGDCVAAHAFGQDDKMQPAL
ncbi:hypothetical protein A6R68_05812 [Neotoma lepida]|uniref:Uncharacterized protein n=1 Tax=Neotoma lepida TaxID=56216 RepID=A0A1A6GHF2_NEOLE|nr:hypothetical protein A6R68_05812 [Neotoma lepida]